MVRPSPVLRGTEVPWPDAQRTLGERLAPRSYAPRTLGIPGQPDGLAVRIEEAEPRDAKVFLGKA